VKCFADDIGGGDYHGYTQKCGTNDPCREQNKREISGERSQRLGGLRSGLDVLYAMHMQRDRGRKHDEISDRIYIRSLFPPALVHGP